MCFDENVFSSMQICSNNVIMFSILYQGHEIDGMQRSIDQPTERSLDRELTVRGLSNSVELTRNIAL